MATLSSKKDVWYGVFTRHGRQKWVRIGRMSKTAARTVLRKLEESFEQNNLGIFKQKKISFTDFSEEYLEYSKTNKSEGTFLRDTISIKHLRKFFKNALLHTIISKDIESYKPSRLGAGVSPRTVNIELRCLSNMLNKAVEWGCLKDTPFRGVKLLKHTKKPPRFLTRQEAETLKSTAPPWLKPVISVLLNTGLREGELRALVFNNIDFTNRRMVVQAQKTNDFRVVPLNEEALETLQSLKPHFIAPQDKRQVLRKRTSVHQNYVFCNLDGTPIKKLTNAIKRTAAKAGLMEVSPHTLRHTFASHLIMNGVDLRTVQKLLGHKTIHTTMMYSHLTEDHLARGVEKLSWASV